MMTFTVPVGTINCWMQMVQTPCAVKPEMIHSMAAMTTTHCMVTILMTRFMAALENDALQGSAGNDNLSGGIGSDALQGGLDDTATAGIQDINQTDFLNGEAVADVDADSNIALTPQSLAQTGVIANV